jgi:hypothetical protein
MAPNFDNNQAYKSNPGGRYSDSMLLSFEATFGLTEEDKADLKTLVNACMKNEYMTEAANIGAAFLNRK